MAWEIQGRQVVCEGWCEVWEEEGSQYTRVDWPNGWGFKGVQEEIPSEVASTLQIGSVAFPPGQFHFCHRLFDQDGLQDNSSASL